MDPVIVAVVGIFALVVGVALGVMLTRSRSAAVVDAAVERAKGEAAAALAAAQAQAAGAQIELHRERGEHGKTREELGNVRNALDTVSDERAKLGERASQVEPLEKKVQAYGQVVDQKNEELRKLSGAEADLKARLSGEEEAHALLKRQHDALVEDYKRVTTDLGNLREEHGQASAKLEAEEAAHGKVRTERDELKRKFEDADKALADLRETNGGTETALKTEREAHGKTTEALNEAKAGRVDAERKLADANRRVGELETELQGERSKAEEKLAELRSVKEDLSNQFKAVANDILDEKSKKFTEQNQVNIGQLLGPLAQQIIDFKTKVEQVYEQEGRDRSALAAHIKTLEGLNMRLSKDAQDLTTALKGQVKTQGNWGEVILEQLLQHAGLERGIHYEVQESHVREDGSRAQPDFVLKLPHDHHMVLDSKVTLVAFTRYTSANTEEEREAARKEHCAAVRAHIKGLSEKNYQKLYNLKSIDYVVMFLPVESAFTLAMGTDESLFRDAWDRNIILCSNSTLLFALRTVAFLWTQDKQNRNAQEIATKGRDLLDKLNLFAQEFESLGMKLLQAQKHYDVALGRFSRGNANVLKQASALVELGVKPTKQLPKGMQEALHAQTEVVTAPALDALDALVIAGLPAPDAEQDIEAAAPPKPATEDGPQP